MTQPQIQGMETGSDGRMTVMVAEGDFVSHVKQREAVAGLLASHFGHEVEIAHTDAGAPFIPGFIGHISVSHCATAVAVAVSEIPVGIDVESHRHEKMRRVARRFIPASDLASAIDSPTRLSATWCAKEAIYKLHRGEGFASHVEAVFPDKKYIVSITHTANYTLAIAKYI